MRDAPYPELLERIEELEAKLKIATDALERAFLRSRGDVKSMIHEAIRKIEGHE